MNEYNEENKYENFTRLIRIFDTRHSELMHKNCQACRLANQNHFYIEILVGFSIYRRVSNFKSVSAFDYAATVIVLSLFGTYLKQQHFSFLSEYIEFVTSRIWSLNGLTDKPKGR